MHIQILSSEHLRRYIDYCFKYRKIHDESYLTDEDLKTYEIGHEELTYLLLQDTEIIGVLSFVLNAYVLAKKTTRIRIFHCVDSNFSHYQILLSHALSYIEKNHLNIEMFLPEDLTLTTQIIKDLGFLYQRTSYVMIRINKPITHISFEEPYILKPFRAFEDAACYQTIRNVAFKNLKGSETPITLELVKELYQEEDLLKDGMRILWKENEPIGIIRVLKEIDETGNYSFIAPLALLPEHQGKGLGKKLLRAGIVIGQENGYPDSMLVVNAENENALSLYLNEGYEILSNISNYLRYTKS